MAGSRLKQSIYGRVQKTGGYLTSNCHTAAVVRLEAGGEKF